MHEFHMGNPVSLGGGVRSTKDPQIGFYFLVDSFCFPIRLGVVCGGERKVVVEEFLEFCYNFHPLSSYTPYFFLFLSLQLERPFLV